MSAVATIAKTLIAAWAVKSFSDYLGLFNSIILPVGNLGVTRSIMPQIEGRFIADYLKWLESKGIKTTKTSILPGALSLTQNEINKDKVIKLMSQPMVTTPLIAVSYTHLTLPTKA